MECPIGFEVFFTGGIPGGEGDIFPRPDEGGNEDRVCPPSGCRPKIILQGIPSCGECPVGTFKNVTGDGPCTPCPAGVNGIANLTTTARNGSTSVDNCIVGMSIF